MNQWNTVRNYVRIINIAFLKKKLVSAFMDI